MIASHRKATVVIRHDLAECLHTPQESAAVQHELETRETLNRGNVSRAEDRYVPRYLGR